MRHRRPTSWWRAPVGQNPAGMGTNARKRPRASARASPPHRLPVSTLCLCARPRSRGTSYRRVAPFATIRQIATHQGEEFPLLRTRPRPRPSTLLQCLAVSWNQSWTTANFPCLGILNLGTPPSGMRRACFFYILTTPGTRPDATPFANRKPAQTSPIDVRVDSLPIPHGP